jgi:hypothetical protein
MLSVDKIVLGMVVVGVVIFFQLQGNVSSASQSQIAASKENEGYQIATINE